VLLLRRQTGEYCYKNYRCSVLGVAKEQIYIAEVWTSCRLDSDNFKSFDSTGITQFAITL